jgi:DNA-binding SARP family transcriptional activator
MPERDASAERRGRPTEAVAPRLALLDGFELRHDGGEVALAVPAQRVLAFLALQRGAVGRDHVAETLWLDSSLERAAGSLRSALWKLRHCGFELVCAHGCRLELAPAVVVDVHQLAGWARRLLHPASDEAALDMRGIAYSGELLPDWYDDWISLERESFRQLRAHALEMLCARLTMAARYGDAVEAGLAAIRGEPLRESAHRALMRAHLAEGNRADALEQYRSFSQRLDRDLGLAPSDGMEALVADLRPR